MLVFSTSQFEDTSPEELSQQQGKKDAPYNQQKSSSLGPAQVVNDIKAGLLGLNACKFSDAVLKTPDNQNVYVCRSLLAVRSSFFAKLFFSDFAERKETVISISLHSKPLKNIVEFAYTGDSTLIRSIASSFPETVHPALKMSRISSVPMSYPQPQSFSSTTERLGPKEILFSSKKSPSKQPFSTTREIHRTEITDLVELATAADYCDIVTLKRWCFKTLDSLIRSNKRTACTALEALGTRAWDEEEHIMSRKSLMQFIAKHPESCLLVPDCMTNPTPVNFNIGDCTGALELSANSMNELLEMNFLEEGHEKRSRGSRSVEYLFQVVYFWGSQGLLPLKHEQLKDPKSMNSRSGLWHAVANQSIEELTKDSDGVADRVKIIQQEQGRPRWSSAKSMTKRLDLTKMRCSFLRDFVEGSGLVPQEDILTAYRHHATRNEDFLLNNGYIINSKGGIVKNDNPFGIVSF